MRWDYTPENGKSGAAVATGKRASALLRAYLATLPGDALSSACIFRHRSRLPYSKDMLGDDFRDIRGDGETRTLADIRRSVALEMHAGGADAAGNSEKLANNLDVNAKLHRTYLPNKLSNISAVDRKRASGRRNIIRGKV